MRRVYNLFPASRTMAQSKVHFISNNIVVKNASSDAHGVARTLRAQEAKSSLLRSDAVCFDVDSTVIMYEGIDVLAAFKGVGDQVSELTRRAMGGSVLFQDAFRDRLSIIQPSRADFEACLRAHPVSLSPRVGDVIARLHGRGTPVFLVSGGMRDMIYPVASLLAIPQHRVFANKILFDDLGNYAGFDPSEPTSRDGGKRAVVQHLMDAHGYKNVVMFGDGATDLQARPPASAVIGYGGVVERDVVRDSADWYMRDFQEVLDVLDEVV